MGRVSIKKALARLQDAPPPRPSSKIGSMPKEQRVEFERDCIAKVLTLAQICTKYSLPFHTVRQYKYRHLKPAMFQMGVRKKVEMEESAKGHLSWLVEQSKDSILEARGQKKDEDGNVIAPNPKAYGTVADLLGKGFEGVRLLGEFLGEINKPGVPQGIPAQIINVISIPKTAGTPQFAPDEDDMRGPDYAHMKLIDISADDAE